MGKVIAICISEEKGTQKHSVQEAEFIEDWGIKGDAHAGKWHRQVSLLSFDKIEDFRARIEDEEERQEDKEVLEQLQIDMLGFVCNGTGKYLARSYELMESIQDLYFQYRGTDDMQGFSQKSEHDRGTILRLKK